MTRPVLESALLAALLCCGAAGQPVLVVDKAGGPGAQFAEIQPAIDAAPPGAVIRVRPLPVHPPRLRK